MVVHCCAKAAATLGGVIWARIDEVLFQGIVKSTIIWRLKFAATLASQCPINSSFTSHKGCTGCRPVGQTVAIKAGISVLMGGIGVIAWIQHVPEYVMFYAFMAILAIYYYVMGAVIKKVTVRAREFL